MVCLVAGGAAFLSRELSGFGVAETAMNAQEAKDWFTYEFTELKGICQQFLTVVVGVLVFSLTFSQKIVRYDSAHWSQRLFLKAGWCCFLVSIIGGGASIVLVMLAGAFVRYPDSGDYQEAQAYSFAVLALSGFVFLLGLICLLVSAFWTSPEVRAGVQPAVSSGKQPQNE
jgi:ABC-type Fe3+ transport system permease subunit